MSEELARLDLTASQGCVMGYLNHREAPACPKDVEAHFHLSHACVSGILTRLEKKGFLTLYPDESDRRYKRIRLLPKGKRCSEMMHRSMERTETQLTQGLTPEQKELFFRFLENAYENMGGSPCRGLEEPTEYAEETVPVRPGI